MRKYPADYRLWFAISGTLFLSATGFWLAADGFTWDGARRIMNDIWCLAVACAAFGWVAHAIAVMCGVRLTGRPAPEQAEDYDDGRPTP